MKSFLIAVFAIGVHFADVAAASAQQVRPARPYRGLFGGGVGDTEQLLSLQLGVGGGYDDNIAAGLTGETGTSAGPESQAGGNFGSLSAELMYTLNRTRVDFSASFATSGRYAPELPNNRLGTHAVSAGGAFQVAKATRVMLSHSTSYQPFMTWSLFPTLTEFSTGEPAIPSQDLAVGDEEYFAHSSNVNLSHNLSRRAAVIFSYDYHLSDFAADDRDLGTQAAAGRFTLGLTRGLGLRLGYGYSAWRTATLAGDGPLRNHNIDAGIDYSRSLSFSRRTTLTFATGSSVIVQDDTAYYRLLGHARLNREIRRTWHAALAYDRDVGFLETFSEPVFSDSANLEVAGLINRRTQFHADAALSVGDVGLSGGDNGFNSYWTTIGVDFGLTRHLALAVNYSFYSYSFAGGVTLPRGLSSDMHRQSVQAQVQLWSPLFKRARRPDASR